MDKATKQATEKRVVSITEVDMSQYFVQGRDQYGTLLHISFHIVDGGVASIPAIDETWIIARQGNQWFLDGRMDSGGETTALALLNPGDRRLDTKGDFYVNAGNVKFAATGVTVNGQAVNAGVSFPLHNSDIASNAAIAASKLAAYPTDGTKALRGDGTWTTGATYGGVISVASSPTDIAWPGGNANNVLIYTSGTGQLRVIGNPTAGNGTRLTIRAGSPITILDHTVGSGSIYTRGVANFVLGANESIEIIWDSANWVEVSRDVAPPPVTTVATTFPTPTAVGQQFFLVNGTTHSLFIWNGSLWLTDEKWFPTDQYRQDMSITGTTALYGNGIFLRTTELLSAGAVLQGRYVCYAGHTSANGGHSMNIFLRCEHATEAAATATVADYNGSVTFFGGTGGIEFVKSSGWIDMAPTRDWAWLRMVATENSGVAATVSGGGIGYRWKHT